MVKEDFATVYRGSVQNLKRREVLNFYLNGDIDDAQIISWSPVLRSREDVLAEFERFVIPALLPFSCPVLNRGKWLGSEDCFSWQGVLASHHGLLTKVLTRWRKVDKPLAEEVSVTSGVALGPQWSGWSTLVSTANRPTPLLPAIDNGSNCSDSELEEHPEGFNFETGLDDKPDLYSAERIQDPITGDIDWKQMNRATQTKASAWAATSPGNKLILISVAFRPVLDLMRDTIRLSSDAWERNEVLKQSEGEVRSYRVVELFLGNSMKHFSASLNMMFHTFTAALPPSSYKLHMRCLFFRLLSRSGAAAEQLYASALRGAPFVVFGALLGLSKPFNDLPPCLRDEFCSWVKENYPTDDELFGEECQAVLHAMARHLDFDIIGVEARHASIRRLTLNKSLQTWTASLSSVSSDWVCRQAVIHAEPPDLHFAKVATAKMSASDPVIDPERAVQATKKWQPRRPPGLAAKTQRGGKRRRRTCRTSLGGAWRIYLHMQYKETGLQPSKQVTKAMAARYRAIKAAKTDEWKHCYHLGLLATWAGRAGKRVFKSQKRQDGKVKVAARASRETPHAGRLLETLAAIRTAGRERAQRKQLQDLEAEKVLLNASAAALEDAPPEFRIQSFQQDHLKLNPVHSVHSDHSDDHGGHGPVLHAKPSLAGAPMEMMCVVPALAVASEPFLFSFFMCDFILVLLIKCEFSRV